MRYGLIENIQELTAYVLGVSKIPYIYYNESGDWEPYLPKFEKQRTKRDEETSACTVFASLSQIETLYNFLYNEEPNYSERFTYNLIPIVPPNGTDPQNTHECIRKRGVIPEQYLPMTNTLAEYANAGDITGSHLAKGLYWLEKHTYLHEWVWNTGNRPDNYLEVLKDALKTSPIAVSVTAWREVDGVYVSDTGGNNHYCLLYKIDDEGYPWVYDTYDFSKKKLAKDHNIRRAKRIHLQKKTLNGMKKHIGILQMIISLFTQNMNTLTEVVERNLGIDVTPKDVVDDSVACVEVATTILRAIYPDVPKEVSTIRMDAWFRTAPGWKKLTAPEAESVIISPTYGRKIGHMGIYLADGTIASNNSFGVNRGRLTKNYTFETWCKKFKVEKGLEVNIYIKS